MARPWETVYWIEAREVVDSEGAVFYRANVANVLLARGEQYRMVFDEDVQRWRIDRRKGA